MQIAERLRRRPRSDDGLTLVEAVVAALLVGILAAVVLGIILQTQSAQIGNRGRVAAANLAAREIDLVRELFMSPDGGPEVVTDPAVVVNANPLTGGTVGEPLWVDGVPYTVTRTAAWNPTGPGASACDGGSMVDYPSLTVSVSVTWPNMGSIQPVTSYATLAPEKGEGVQSTSSFVAVSVVDSKGRPSAGRSVSITAPGFSAPGTTDPTGCAVIEVSPSSSGTAYQATMTDTGYVDISGNPNPSKAVGTLTRGVLNNSVTFAYDRAGTVVLQVTGSGLTDGDVTGGQATLIAAEYSGSSGESLHTLGGLSTSITGLWPTMYSGYFGTTAPSATHSVELPPGGTVTLPIDFTPATVTFTDLPAGTTGLVVVPAGSGLTCGSPGSRSFAASAPSTHLTLLPGEWDVFVVGSYFSCSPGDPVGYALGPGENGEMPWVAPSTVTITGSVPAGAIWAVDRAMAGTLGSCPGGAVVPIAQDVSAARGGTASLPAGEWYLYVTDGAADGACQALAPGAISPFALAANDHRTLVWPANSISLRITNVENLSGGTGSGTRPSVLISSSSSLTCTRTATTPAIGAGTTNLGAPTSQSTVITTVVSEGTWYLYGWDTRTSGAWSTRCQPAGTVHVGPGTGPLTIDFNRTSPGSVGP